jgi:hypothetical protein
VQAATVFPGGCTKGELTLLGQRQARDLGAWLRDRYVNQAQFLPPNFEVCRDSARLLWPGEEVGEPNNGSAKAGKKDNNYNIVTNDNDNNTFPVRRPGVHLNHHHIDKKDVK